MKKYRFQVFIFWLLFASGVISIYGVFYLASIGYFGEMPDFRQLENPKTNFASEIISSDNKNFTINLFTDYNERISFAVYNTLGQTLVFNNIDKDLESYMYDLDMSYAATGVYIIKIGNSTVGYKTARIIVK